LVNWSCDGVWPLLFRKLGCTSLSEPFFEAAVFLAESARPEAFSSLLRASTGLLPRRCHAVPGFDVLFSRKPK